MTLPSYYLLGSLMGLVACADPRCRPNERKVGNVCFDVEPESDSSTDPATRTDAAAYSEGGPSIDSSNADAIMPPEHDISDATTSRSADTTQSDAQGTGNACFLDEDGDGYGVGPATAPCPARAEPPKEGDCNDRSALAYPGAAETCGDQLDNDCNGMVDDGPPERCNGIDDDCDPATPTVKARAARTSARTLAVSPRVRAKTTARSA